MNKMKEMTIEVLLRLAKGMFAPFIEKTDLNPDEVVVEVDECRNFWRSSGQGILDAHHDGIEFRMETGLETTLGQDGFPKLVNVGADIRYPRYRGAKSRGDVLVYAKFQESCIFWADFSLMRSALEECASQKKYRVHGTREVVPSGGWKPANGVPPGIGVRKHTISECIVTEKALTVRKEEFLSGDFEHKLGVEKLHFEFSVRELGQWVPCPDPRVKEVTPPTPRPPVSPAVKKLADKAGIDLSRVEGTGKKGAVLKKDVLREIEAIEALVNPAGLKVVA